MLRKNKKIWDWFDKEEICQAILGKGDFFIPDPTYREKHDRLLIFRQLIYWANNDKIKRKKAAVFFNSILIELSKTNKINEAADIIWSYFICIDDLGKNLPIDISFMKKKINQMIVAKGKLISEDSELRELIIALEKRIDEV